MVIASFVFSEYSASAKLDYSLLYAEQKQTINNRLMSSCDGYASREHFVTRWKRTPQSAQDINLRFFHFSSFLLFVVNK